jgi:molybdate transport system substrate-binding protein
VILPREGIGILVKDGKAVGGNIVPLARVGMYVAVPNGAPKPDISSPEAFKRTLLAAKSIAYLDPAAGDPSGIHVANVINRLGIATEMKSKTVFYLHTSEVASLIASGKAELVVHQLGNLRMVSGIDIVGPLPGDLQQSIVHGGDHQQP